ncbi:MAG: N-acetylneuraminate synthase family protein [Acidobacteriota bacterium]|jgi:N-acetylneuraminate synthase/N,N'-diacetyllegionaminate synthase|nr:N-acetylneuraminate synthase family protein [Acidobacteriota bacterium]
MKTGCERTEIRQIRLGGRIVGSGAGVFVIAEIGINHNGSVEEAAKLIDAAADCGADAVKFQSFRADRLLICSRDRYAQQSGGESAYDLLRRCELSFHEQEKLKAHADKRGIMFISTPFDEEGVDFLDSLGVPAFKVASGDITHMPLLRRIAEKGKPVFLSTGMSYLEEVIEAVNCLREGGAEEILLMHCAASYPASSRDMNLRALETLRSRFGLPVGLSDHSRGILFSIAAAALGASAVERHFTLDRGAEGPDHKASLSPDGLKKLVNNLRRLKAGMGSGEKRPAESEADGRRLGRRSVVAAVDIQAGGRIVSDMLTCKRPGTGIAPGYLDRIAGMTPCRFIAKDALITWEDLGLSAPPPPGEQGTGL